MEYVRRERVGLCACVCVCVQGIGEERKRRGKWEVSAILVDVGTESNRIKAGRMRRSETHGQDLASAWVVIDTEPTLLFEPRPVCVRS